MIEWALPCCCCCCCSLFMNRSMSRSLVLTTYVTTTETRRRMWAWIYDCVHMCMEEEEGRWVTSGGSESPEPEDLQARALLPTHICSMLINDLIQELITQFACSDCCNGCLFHFEDEDGGKAPMGHRRRNGLGPCYKIFNYLMINIYTYIT